MMQQNTQTISAAVQNHSDQPSADALVQIDTSCDEGSLHEAFLFSDSLRRMRTRRTLKMSA